MPAETQESPQEKIHFRVTLQPRRLGFARKLTIEDVYHALSELKERHPSLFIVGGGPPAFIVYAEGIRKNMITGEQELQRYAQSEETKNMGVYYSNPTTQGAALGNSRIEFRNHEGSVAGALRIRDRYPGVKPVFLMGIGMIAGLVSIMSYFKHTLTGLLFKMVLGACFLLTINGYRGIRNNNIARIQFDISVSDEETYHTMSLSLSRIRL